MRHTTSRRPYSLTSCIYWLLVRQIGDVRRLKGVFMSLTHAAHHHRRAQPGGVRRHGKSSRHQFRCFSRRRKRLLAVRQYLHPSLPVPDGGIEEEVPQAVLGRSAVGAGGLRHRHAVARGNGRTRRSRSVLLVEEPEKATDCGAFRARGSVCPGVGAGVIFRSHGHDCDSEESSSPGPHHRLEG